MEIITQGKKINVFPKAQFLLSILYTCKYIYMKNMNIKEKSTV